MNKKLRLGLLIDTLDIPAWFYRSLERIVKAETAEFILFILNLDPSQNVRQKTASRRRNHFLYDLFNEIDEKLFVRGQSASETRNIRNIFINPEMLGVKPKNIEGLSEITAEDVQKIREYQLDILFQIGFHNLRGDIYRSAKYGIWSISYNASQVLKGDPTGYWEVVENIQQTSAILKMKTSDSSRYKILYCSHYFTYPFSPARNKNELYWSASSILPRQMEALVRLGERDFFKAIEKKYPEMENHTSKEIHLPSNRQVISHSFSLVSKIIHEMYLRALFLPTWYLMYSTEKSPEITPNSLNPIYPPKDRFWADPHVISSDGKYYVFVEEYTYKRRKGHISVIELNPNHKRQLPVCVLDKEYHLSYPFVFLYHGKFYMVPESAKNRTIDLYECIDFPYQWKYRMTLMPDVRAVDTTLFLDRGYWWMFTALVENEECTLPSELFLFYSEELFSTAWIPHPGNPIVSDIRKSRPAGGLFKEDGKLYRPSQHTTDIYGYGIDFNEVSNLSTTDYSEKEVNSIRPTRENRILAMHTFTKAEELTMVDAFVYRNKVRWPR